MQGKVALVTGAGRGIGRTSALRLAAGEARVAVTARSREQLETLAAEIQSRGQQVLVIADDLGEPDAPQRIVERVEQHWGPVEILVNNAGIGSSQNPQRLIDFDDEFWELTMRINVTAPYRLTKLVLPAMLQGGWGRIINIASVNARVASVHGAAYTASKHALAGLTRATAQECGDSAITANAVCPGVTATEMNDKRLEYDAQRLGKTIAELEAAASPLGRRLDPDEVAVLVAFLARDEARAINGQLINVCGGRVMS